MILVTFQTHIFMVSSNDMIDLLFTYLIIEMQMMLFMREMGMTMTDINCG